MEPSKIGDKRVLLLGIRQALLIALGAIEDYLDVKRTVKPLHKQTEQERRMR
jgi:hypothetical protein